MPVEFGAGRGFMLAAAVLAADQFTKTAVSTWVEYGSRHELLPMLNIVHVLNPGAAFSFLHDAGGWQRTFLVAIALVASVFLSFMIWRRGTSAAERMAFGAILGGALANVMDRVTRGAVVDWIDLHWDAHHWPAFNVADIGISAGVAVLLVREFVSRQASREVEG